MGLRQDLGSPSQGTVMYARLCPGRPEQALGYRRQSSSWDGSIVDPHHISLEWLTPTQQQTIRQQLLVVMFDVAGVPSDTNAR